MIQQLHPAREHEQRFQFTKHIQIIARNVLFLLLLEVNTVAGGFVSLPGDLRAAHMSCCCVARNLPSSNNPNTRIPPASDST